MNFFNSCIRYGSYSTHSRVAFPCDISVLRPSLKMASAASTASKTLLERHSQAIKDKSFLQLGLLEAHNACSADVDSSLGVISDNVWINRINDLPKVVQDIANKTYLKQVCKSWAKTQTLSLSSLLEDAGVRSLDIRIALAPDGTLFVHHTFHIYPLETALRTIASFLSAHPLEFLQIKLKWTDTQQTTDLCAQIQTALEHTDLIKLTVSAEQRTSKIHQLVEWNKRLFVFVDQNHPVDAPYPSWAAGWVREFLDRYIESNDSNDKIAQMHQQICDKAKVWAEYMHIPVLTERMMYTVSYTLTPTTEDVVKSVVSGSCCGLFKDAFTLAHLNDSLPPLDTAFPLTDWQLVNSASLDFVVGNESVAEWLLLLP